MSDYRGPTEDEVELSIASWIRQYVNDHEKKGEKGVQAKLARQIGVRDATISNIMGGAVGAGLKVLIGVHFGLGEPPNEVMRFPHDGLARAVSAPPHTTQTKGAGRKRAGAAQD